MTVNIVDRAKITPSEFSDTLYEEYTPSVRTMTIRAKDAIYYAVEVRQHNEWVTEWSRTVPVLQRTTHRPGGPAFVWAARQQDIEAKCWVGVLSPQVGEA